MRHALLTTILLAALLAPLACFAAADDDDDEEMDAMVQMMQNAEGIPQANLGEEDNGWYFERKDGVCSMYSFNDPLVIQADPSNPLGTQLQFRMIDSLVPEENGAQVPMILAMRDSADDEFQGGEATLVASRESKTYGYLMVVPLDQLVARYPDGFQAVLLDKDQKRIMQSDTLGSRKHLASLQACSKGG
jgi:hypothetical protein